MQQRTAQESNSGGRGLTGGEETLVVRQCDRLTSGQRSRYSQMVVRATDAIEQVQCSKKCCLRYEMVQTSGLISGRGRHLGF